MFKTACNLLSTNSPQTCVSFAKRAWRLPATPRKSWYLDITPGEYAVHRTIQREELEYHDFLADVEGAILFRCSNVWKKIRCGNTLYNGRSEFPKHSDRKNPDETLNVTRISQ
uniref:Uncharacterized protein n=1 Tax=Rhipicephalus zambeziensis TaxID=60191 RepID=A0A224YCP4_9ACAR